MKIFDSLPVKKVKALKEGLKRLEAFGNKKSIYDHFYLDIEKATIEISYSKKAENFIKKTNQKISMK